MQVILVNGSPHQQGCTSRALSEVAAQLEKEGIQTLPFWLGKKAISGCLACQSCRKTGYCIHNDLVKQFMPLAQKSQGFIFGSPVHYAGISGGLTSFMDCLFYSAPKGTFILKPAAGVVSARRGGTTAAFDQLNKYFTISQMPVVSSCYWNMVHGSTPQEVEEDQEGLYIMRSLGRNMAYLLKCLALGREGGLSLPGEEPPRRTNFIR